MIPPLNNNCGQEGTEGVRPWDERDANAVKGVLRLGGSPWYNLVYKMAERYAVAALYLVGVVGADEVRIQRLARVLAALHLHARSQSSQPIACSTSSHAASVRLLLLAGLGLYKGFPCWPWLDKVLCVHARGAWLIIARTYV